MTESGAPDEKTLRYLKTLVTVLTATMILGLLTIVALLVMRFGALGGDVDMPDQITLPDGAVATAFTRGDDWFAVVTEGDEILIYSTTGMLQQRIEITP